jgi:hypothetical protein
LQFSDNNNNKKKKKKKKRSKSPLANKTICF